GRPGRSGSTNSCANGCTDSPWSRRSGSRTTSTSATTGKSTTRSKGRAPSSRSAAPSSPADEEEHMTVTDGDVFGRLDGRVVLVTGAASGIGAASMRLFRAVGAEVVGVDLAPGSGIVQADVSDPAQVAEVVDEVVARHGRLDVVHGNAGVNVPGRPHSLTDDDYRKVMGVCCDA